MLAEKGSFAAPLFFLSLVFAAAGSTYGTVALWAMSAVLLSLPALRRESVHPPQPWIEISVFAYGLCVALSALLTSPAYTPAGLYHPLLLVLAYSGARRLSDREAGHAAFAALALGAILAAWGIVQVGLAGFARAQALFETPATYAAVLNLLLLPLLVRGLVLGRGSYLLAIAVLLATGVFAADSRGGVLALTAGLGAALALGIRGGVLRRRALLVVPVVMAAAWALAFVLRSSPAADLPAPTPEVRAESSISRVELYSLSLGAWREQPLAGTGYLTFRYVLEKGREYVPSYGKTSETWFVHNDYLQTLQELGPIGLLAFLGLSLLPPLLAYRRLPTLPAAQRPVVVGAAAGLASMAVHALVDFPFYVPLCLVLYGALLGVLDRALAAAAPSPRRDQVPAGWARVARTAGVTAALVVFLRPVAAEAAAEWGLRKFAGGEGQRAAFWLGAAQRLDPGDWRYHWYAGQFWDAQAADSGKREAAQLAADAYAAGFAANPLEVKNLLGKISVHRRHVQLLRDPADQATLRQWRQQASALAPLNPSVRRALAR